MKLFGETHLKRLPCITNYYTVTKANAFRSEFDSADGVSVCALTRVNKNKYSEDIKLLASGLDSYISGTVEV